MIKSAQISAYLKQAGKNCPFSFRKRLRMDLKNNLSDYLEENPDSTMEDVMQHFGSPEKFADEYVLAMDDKLRKKTVFKAKCVKRSVLIGVIVIVLTVVITAAWIITENSQTAGVYYSEGIIEDT